MRAVSGSPEKHPEAAPPLASPGSPGPQHLQGRLGGAWGAGGCTPSTGCCVGSSREPGPCPQLHGPVVVTTLPAPCWRYRARRGKVRLRSEVPSCLQWPRVTSHPGSPGTEGLLGRGGAFGAKPGNVPERPCLHKPLVQVSRTSQTRVVCVTVSFPKASLNKEAGDANFNNLCHLTQDVQNIFTIFISTWNPHKNY